MFMSESDTYILYNVHSKDCMLVNRVIIYPDSITEKKCVLFDAMGRIFFLSKFKKILQSKTQ